MAYTEEQQAIIDAARARAAAGAAAPPSAEPAQGRTRDQIISEATQRAANRPSTVEDAAKSFGSGVVRGATALADLPADAINLGYDAAEWVTGREVPEWLRRSSMLATPGGMTRGVSGKSATEVMTEAAPEVMGYQPSTQVGRYAKTTGEFVPAAVGTALTGGTSLLPTVLRGAVAPAIASEAAGQLASEYYPQSKWAEPAARLAGSILGGMAATAGEKAVKSIISPSGGANPSALRAADDLRAAGVPVTAGQATGNPAIKAIEANNPNLQAFTQVSKDGGQLKDFTHAGLRMAGLTDDVVDDIVQQARATGAPVNPTLANPLTMRVLNDSLSKRFNDVLSGVDYTPDRKLLDAIVAARGPAGSMPHGMQPFVAISSRIGHAARTGQTIPAAELQAMRSSLGPYTTSQVTAHQQAAHLLRDALDDAIDSAVQMAGQPERMQSLLKLRQDYQNFMAIEAALKVGSPLGVNGIITPQDLARAVASQGKRRMITGGRDTGNLAMAGVDRLGALPQATRGFGRSGIAAIGEGLASLASYPAVMMAGNFLGAHPMLSTGAAGLTAITAGTDAARRLATRALEKYAHTPTVQRYLQNQLTNPSAVPSATVPALSGAVVSERAGRKAGGRVGVAHDKLADQLVGAAERAKKGISKDTETLLDMPDDHIAHALEVANRSI